VIRVLSDALFLARTETLYLLRRRETLLWTFVMPIVFFYFIGAVTTSESGNSREDLAVMAPPDAGFLADQVLARVEARGYHVVRTQTPVQWLAFRRRIEIPAGFTDSVLAGKPMRIRFERTGEDVSADYDRVRLSRAIYTVLADLIVATRSGAKATPDGFTRLSAQPRNLDLDVRAAGKRVEPPAGFEQSVPGTMVMFTLLVLFTSGAVTLTIERNQGILRRLASAPMSRGAVVLGKWGSRMALGIVQIAFAMIAGSVLFHVRWGPNLGMVIAILFAYGALAAMLGMLLGNLGRTESQVIALGVIASNLMAGLGGCWWPIEVAPLWAQKLALFLPTGWTMDALHKLVNFGASPVAVIPHLTVTLLAVGVAGYALAGSFRFQ
jgi:ABC-type Na+ efflux pump permease subunit